MYTCPKCRVRYCSAACFKQHRQSTADAVPTMCDVEQQRLATQLAQQAAAAASAVPEPPPILSAVVDERALQRLSQSRRLRDALDDAELRSALRRVVGVPPAERAQLIARARLEDRKFDQLATDILDLVVGAGTFTAQRSCP